MPPLNIPNKKPTKLLTNEFEISFRLLNNNLNKIVKVKNKRQNGIIKEIILAIVLESIY